jgi:transcriptional regulator with XRE-family HTH domain
VSDTWSRTEVCTRCGQSRKVVDGSSLRQIRKEKGLSLREFAFAVGVSPAYICDIELNRRRVTPRMEMAYGALKLKA